MKILIVGGGVAGPALAGFLKDSAEITLIDKAPKWGNIGYAITIWGNGRRMLRELGLEQHVLKNSYEIPWETTEDKKGHILKVCTFDAFSKYGSTVVVTRTDLQQALTKNIEGKVRIKMGTTISNLVQSESKVTVTLTDGTTEDFDLVVGADGIHSQVREMVFGNEFLKYYGWTVDAFWSPKEFAPPKGAIIVSTGGKICFVYPMQDKAVVMLATKTDKETIDKNEHTKEALHKTFADFKDSVGHLIDAIEDPEHMFRDNLAHIDMDRWYKRRVVLMGDAQHATTPLTGMGSSLALEDAYVLAEELKQNTDINKALENYEKRRTKRIKNFRKMSDFVETWLMPKSVFKSWFIGWTSKFVPASVFVKEVEKVVAEEI